MPTGSNTKDVVIRRLRDFFRRHWQQALRIRERLPLSEEAFHLVMAGAVGMIGGLANLIFFKTVDTLEEQLWHESGDLGEIAEAIDPWIRLISPAIGGLAAGLILYWGVRIVKKKGSPNLLEVVVAGDGRLPFRSAMIKSASSMISIGTGASIGREGAISHIAATLASKWGQLAEWQPYRLRLLVACGAASGIAAAYNAPITGAVFAALVVLGNFSMNLFAPLVFSSVIAAMVSRTFFGIGPVYQVPNFHFGSLMQLPWFVLLGILSGGVGSLFLVCSRWSEKFFEKLPIPTYARLALGGLFVGVIAVWFPAVWGNGYSETSRILHENFYESRGVWFLFAMVAAKFVATVITVGSGTVGGVMTPTLFWGAGLGSCVGLALNRWLHVPDISPGSFALVGMGCALAATTHSPLLAMMMVFEISLNYSLMPPLMLGCVVATLIARSLHESSVYTEPLRAKGVEGHKESWRLGAATEQSVAGMMRQPIEPVRETASLQELGNRFLTSSNNFLPVVDEERRLLGVVALQDLKEYLNAGSELRGVIAYDVMRPPPPCLTPNLTLSEALPILLSSEQRNIPVVNSLKEYRLVGSVVRAEALGLISEAIAASYSNLPQR